MRWWLWIILWLLAMPGWVAAQNEVNEEKQSLEDRVQALEDRLDKLDRIEVIKQVREYICPGGEIYDALPPGNRCPDGSIPKERVSLRKLKFSRRESLAEKIEAAFEEAEAKRVAVGGSARGILQQVIHNPGGDQLFSQGSVDLFFISRPMAFSTFFVDLEAIGGAGPDETVGSLSRLNTDAETLGVTDQVKIREAWMLARLLSDQVQVAVGKVDLTNFFDLNTVANDETLKFLNTALVNNPLLKQPPNGPGLVIRYESGKEFGVGVGVQSSNGTASTIGEKVYAIGELDYHTPLFFPSEGNYRLWGRLGRGSDDLDKKSWGVGISLYHQITTRAAVFARAGLGRTEGEGRNAYAWSTGLEWLSPFQMWIKDRTGLAFSRQIEADRSESVAEAYYRHFLTDRLTIALDFQWIFSGINSVTGQRNKNVAVPGFRTTVNF